MGTASIAIGVATMIIAFSVLLGFKHSIKEKLFTLSAHLQVGKITLNRSYDETPIRINNETTKLFQNNQLFKSNYKVVNKAAILKSENEIAGILLKGISSDYDSTLFQINMLEGRWIRFDAQNDSKEIIISRYLSKKIGVKLNDFALIYFVQNPPRARKLKVVGIYDTGLVEFDKNLIISDLKLLQNLNGWESNQIGHYEVVLKNVNQLTAASQFLSFKLPQDLEIKSVIEQYPQFFEWFDLLDRNIQLVIFLIMVVAAFNMISVLLIMIMERIPMIGLLKAVGMRNKKIRLVFMTNGFLIISKGLLYGNIIGLLLAFTQKKFELIPLDPENYYVSSVPILIDITNILFINILTFIIVGLTLLIPTLFIKKINPIMALKYKD